MKVYFGDNQFLSVNHTGKVINSYDSPEDIAFVLRSAWQTGIRDFSFTVAPQTVKAINLVIDDCPFNLHPAIPYAQYVNNKLTELGVFRFFISLLKSINFFSLLISFVFFLFGSKSRLISQVIKIFIADLPLDKITSVSLLNVATDMFIGSRRSDLLESFANAVRRLGFKPSFYTMNPVDLMNLFWSEGKNQDVRIIFNFNESGFRVNPSFNDVKAAIDKFQDFDKVAMSIFSGSGSSDPISFFCSSTQFSGVLFGSSNPKRIEDNFRRLTS